jgi:hypothetical protein
MARFFVAVIGVVFGASQTVDAGEEPNEMRSPRNVIERAVAAHGGKTALAKFVTYSYRTDTVLFIKDDKRTVKSEGICQAPGQYTVVSRFGSGDSLIQWLNNDRAWQQINDEPVEELRGETLRFDRFKNYMWHVVLLYPLLEDDTGFQLARSGEFTVDGRRATRIVVTKKDQEPLSLFFDIDRGLLIKLQCKTYDRYDNKERELEEVYTDFKDFTGATFPAKTIVYIEGKKTGERTAVDMKPLAKQPDEVFSPKK